MDPVTLHVLVVVFIATFVRSTFGFGEAMIAVPLLTLKIPIEVAAPVAVLLSVTVALVVVIMDWRHIHVSSAAWLLAPTVLGVPLGILLLASVPQPIVKGALAAVIIAFSAYCLIGKKPPELRCDSKGWMLGCGFFAGVLGGAYGVNGPPLIVYGAMRRWSPQHFRATLQAYFLPASALAVIGYWIAGLWVANVTHYFLISLPVAIPAILLGRLANGRLKGDTFLKYVHVGLICVGTMLLIQAFATVQPAIRPL